MPLDPDNARGERAELKEMVRAIARETAKEVVEVFAERMGLYSPERFEEFRRAIEYIAVMKHRNDTTRDSIVRGVVDKLIAIVGTVIVGGICAAVGIYASTKGIKP